MRGTAGKHAVKFLQRSFRICVIARCGRTMPKLAASGFADLRLNSPTFAFEGPVSEVKNAEYPRPPGHCQLPSEVYCLQTSQDVTAIACIVNHASSEVAPQNGRGR